MYLCVTASVSCGVEVSRMINKNHIPGKRNGSRQTKGNIGIIVTLFFFFCSSFWSLRHSPPLFPHPTSRTVLKPSKQFSFHVRFHGKPVRRDGVHAVCLCTCVCVCVSVAALWVRNSRICPESSFILRHVSS